MKAGRYPESGVSQLTLRTYRLGPDGERTGPVQRHTVTSDHDPERLKQSLPWPPCRCPRCRTGDGPAPR